MRKYLQYYHHKIAPQRHTVYTINISYVDNPSPSYAGVLPAFTRSHGSLFLLIPPYSSLFLLIPPYSSLFLLISPYSCAMCLPTAPQLSVDLVGVQIARNPAVTLVKYVIRAELARGTLAVAQVEEDAREASKD